jgi:hypothetical protein
MDYRVSHGPVSFVFSSLANGAEEEAMRVIPHLLKKLWIGSLNEPLRLVQKARRPNVKSTVRMKNEVEGEGLSAISVNLRRLRNGWRATKVVVEFATRSGPGYVEFRVRYRGDKNASTLVIPSPLPPWPAVCYGAA